MEKLLEKARDAVARGATELCIQGGIHPHKDHTHYREILVALKREFPQLHIHAFSPEEIDFGHKKSGMALDGVSALAGRRGPRDDAGHRGRDPRRRDPRDHLAAQAAAAIAGSRSCTAAHAIGLRSTSTLMYGHIEQARHVARASRAAARHPEATGGFTEFVPLGFIHEKNVLFNHMHARPGASMPEDVRAGRGGAPVPAPVDPERADVVGEDGAEARAARRCWRARTISAAR